jgi:ribosomal protein S6--L-glutamate ligase
MAHSRLHVIVLAEGRYLSQRQPTGLVRALRGAGHAVTVIDPSSSAYDIGDHRWLDRVDLVVARGRSRELFYLLTWAEARGVRTINRSDAIARVHNKAHLQIALADAGLPTPRSFLGPVARLAAAVPASVYPLIVKPMFGDNARGLKIVESAHALSRLDWPETTALAQEFLRGTRYDLKICVIGEEVWAVQQPSPIHWPTSGPQGPSPNPQPVSVTEPLRALARTCGARFGLQLFGIDCLEVAGRLHVIEVNDFPNYSGVPDCDERLAAYVVHEALRENAHYASRISNGPTSSDAKESDLPGGSATPHAVGRESRRDLPRRSPDGSRQGDRRARSVRPEIGD